MLKTFKSSSLTAILMLSKTSFGDSIKIFLVYFKNYGKGLVLSLWPLLYWSAPLKPVVRIKMLFMKWSLGDLFAR